jgi:hypothetical protein
MQCACAILSSVACPALQHITASSHKGHDFRKRKKVIDHKTCLLVFSTTFDRKISHSEKKTERDVIKMCIGSHVKCTCSCQILMKI